MAQEQPPTRPHVGRSAVMTRDGIVAASQPLAAAAGARILARGGTAVDAAIAANAVLGVVEPTSNGIGGDLFAIVSRADSDEVLALNASGWSPAGLTVQRLRAAGWEQMPARGIHSVTVPGAVAGWAALHDRFGRLPLAEVLAPAIHYAEEGFPVSEVVARLWTGSEAFLAENSGSSGTFLRDGHAPRAGEIFVNPDLGRTLRRIGEHGRDGFYRGPVAEAIVAVSRALEGVMASGDLAEFHPEWVEPLSVEYRGWRVYELPPNGQGIAALLMLEMMELYPLGLYGLQSADALHVMIEIKKLAYADMLRYVGDPRVSDVPVVAMLDQARLDERARLVDTTRASCAVESDPWLARGAHSGDTIYLSVVDREGTIVSLIQSNYSGFGSGVVPEGAGFMLQNRGALFTLEEHHPNRLEPRKRPLHTIIPGFMHHTETGTRIGFGIMGGWNQAQAHAQFVAHVVDYGLTIQEALEAGRFTKRTFDGCDVQVEALVPAATIEALRARGHEVEVVPPRSSAFGYGQAVIARPDGVHVGASDPRHDGAAVPEPAPVFDERRVVTDSTAP